MGQFNYTMSCPPFLLFCILSTMTNRHPHLNNNTCCSNISACWLGLVRLSMVRFEPGPDWRFRVWSANLSDLNPIQRFLFTDGWNLDQRFRTLNLFVNRLSNLWCTLAWKSHVSTIQMFTIHPVFYHPPLFYSSHCCSAIYVHIHHERRGGLAIPPEWVPPISMINDEWH